MPSAQPSLDELAQRIRASDRAAFTEAFQRLKDPLVRYTQRITHDVPAAYDVLQDVFTRLWERRAGLAPDTTLQALLYTMARNRALNLQRRAARIAFVDVERVGEERSVAVPPDASADVKQLEARIRRWIDELPPRRAEAFVLSRYHGLSHSEISEVMGLSERTVQTHVHHALRDLRARLRTLDR